MTLHWRKRAHFPTQNLYKQKGDSKVRVSWILKLRLFHIYVMRSVPCTSMMSGDIPVISNKVA